MKNIKALLHKTLAGQY